MLHKRLPLHADWEEVSCGRPVPRTQDQWGRWSWLCSRLPDLYSVQTAQCTTHYSPVVSDKYHHSVVSVLLLCCRCQLNKMTPKLNQTCLVNVRERVSYLCLVKFTDGWTWMSWLHKINLLSIYKHVGPINKLMLNWFFIFCRFVMLAWVSCQYTKYYKMTKNTLKSPFKSKISISGSSIIKW